MKMLSWLRHKLKSRGYMKFEANVLTLKSNIREAKRIHHELMVLKGSEESGQFSDGIDKLFVLSQERMVLLDEMF